MDAGSGRIMPVSRIFILGLQRSGTTWLANMLAASSDVAAVVHEDHQGVHESVFFSHFARNFGPWSHAAARAAFCEAFAQSDYFRLTGLAVEQLQEIVAASRSYGDVFVEVMDRFADSQNARAWIEKSPHHTLLHSQISMSVPGAIFLCVERDLSALIQSRLHGFGRKPDRGTLTYWLDVLRGAVTALMYRHEMRSLAKHGHALLLRYEDLKKPDTRTTILEYLGLDPDAADMESGYSANSSFQGARPPSFAWPERTLIAAVAIGVALIPGWVLRALKERRQSKRGADWPDWVWSQTDFDVTELQQVRDRTRS